MPEICNAKFTYKTNPLKRQSRAQLGYLVHTV